MKEDEKEQLLYSESYPLNEKKERSKVKPISEVHKLLSGVKIDKEKIYYKPLSPEHVEEVKKLHKEWFPVAYEEQIFTDSIVNNQGAFVTEGAFYYLPEENREVILGLILCRWCYIERFFFDMVGNNIIKELNDSIDYEEEVQFFLSKQLFYTSLYVMSLGVIDECRKMNIGTNLLKDMMNYSVNVPFCLGIFLNVITDNFSGKKFYEKNGLVCSNHVKDFYEIDNKKYDSDTYVKIFERKIKDKVRQYHNSMMTFKEKCFKYLILKPFYVLVKLFLMFCLCRCFVNKVKIHK